MVTLDGFADKKSTIFVDGADLSADGKTLICVPYCKNAYDVPDGVTHIGKSAFECCLNLQRIIFKGRGLLEIGEKAFNVCDNIKEIHVPNGCKERYASIKALTPFKNKIIEDK